MSFLIENFNEPVFHEVIVHLNLPHPDHQCDHENQRELSIELHEILK